MSLACILVRVDLHSDVPFYMGAVALNALRLIVLQQEVNHSMYIITSSNEN